MEKEAQQQQLNDIFSGMPSTTLESNGIDDETSKEKQTKQEEEE